MAITPLPTPPSRNDPTNFASRGDAFLAALPTFATEANSLASDVNADAAAAAQSVIDAADEVVLAQAAVTDAQAAVAAAAAAAGATKWISGTTYTEGAVVWSPITYLSYRRKSTGGGTTDPSADSTNWAQAAGTGDVTQTGTQTLTNKTIVDPIVTLGAGQGTAGQVPVSQGAGLPPVWGDVESLGAGGASASGSVVLTASSAAMQLITPTALGQAVTLPNATTLSEGIPIFNIKNVGPYEMLLLDGAGNRVGVIGAGGYAVCSLFDNSTAAGTWQISGIQYSAVFETFSLALARNPTPAIQYLEVDTGKHLFVFVESATDRIYGVVYDEATNTAGAATLIRALPGNPGNQPAGITRISATQVLIVSCATNNNSTAAEAVVLGISGTTITVNTPTGFTLSANAARIGSPVQVGTSFVLPYGRFGSPWQQAYRAMTVSGTTVTVGSETVAAGTADNTNFAPTVIPLSATTFFSIANDQSTELICLVGTISGTTVSTGAVSTLACADSVPAYHVRKLSTGRISVLWGNNSDLRGAILTISGTSISKSEISIGTKSGSGAAFTAVNIGDVFVAAWSSGASSNNGARALIDSGGTAQAGTLTTFPNSVASSGVQSIGQTETNLYLKIQNTTTSATFIRAYVSGSDLAYEELGQVAGAGVSFVGSVTNNRSVANERGPSVLVGQAAIGSPQGGELAMLIGGRAKPVYNEPSGFSSTFEQTSLNKGWFVIDGTTTTFRRMEMI